MRVRAVVPILPANLTMVRANAGGQAAAGLLLAAGAFPRSAAAFLACSLIPTTIAGHPFWAADEEARAGEVIHFAKNAAVLGGLLAVLGRPSQVREPLRAQ
jgi:uncharacterized membrane protein YphA (DoxX/SURF4 family)